jgi:hypothetical protein
MSGNFKLSASIGSTVIAEDVLFTSLHPGLNSANGSWTKNPMYSPISLVPLKVGLLNQFRKNARAVSGENESLADIEVLEDKFKKNKAQISKLQIVSTEIEQFISQNSNVHE